jgi:RNA polymerase sigma-70 factor, ECF subfamily
MYAACVNDATILCRGDETLLDAARRGDQRAQTELFNTHKDRVAKQVQWMTGDASSVDDLVQEVFVAAFAALPGFRGTARVETWLHAIAANKVRNWWDAHRRRGAREETAGSQHRDAPMTPEETLEARQHRERLYAALAQLSDDYREAFTARAIEHLSLRQASETLGIPISTVSYRARRAEQLLCETLGLEVPPSHQPSPSMRRPRSVNEKFSSTRPSS